VFVGLIFTGDVGEGGIAQENNGLFIFVISGT